MPPCDARYDAILTDGFVTWNGFGEPRTTAVLDFIEERLPDEFGDPGPLVSAVLERYWTDNGKRVRYSPLGTRNRMALWVNGQPTRAAAKHRRYLRWRWVEPEPPIDPEYDDPA